MSKILTVRTTCLADVDETWTFHVPDDFTLPDDKEEQRELIFDVLDSGGASVNGEFVAVEDKADNEHDREIQAVELSADKVPSNPERYPARSILSEQEWDRLTQLLRLLNDLSVTQIDHHESAELQALLAKLRS